MNPIDHETRSTVVAPSREPEMLEETFDARHARMVDGRLVHQFFHHVATALPEAARSRSISVGPDAHPLDPIGVLDDRFDLGEVDQFGLGIFLDLFVVSLTPAGDQWLAVGLLNEQPVTSGRELLCFAAEQAIACWFQAELNTYPELVPPASHHEIDRIRRVFGRAVLSEQDRRKGGGIASVPLVIGDRGDTSGESADSHGTAIDVVRTGGLPPLTSELFLCWYPERGRTLHIFNSSLDGKETLLDIGRSRLQGRGGA